MPDPTDPVLPTVDVHVVYWCTGDVHTAAGVDETQYQIKIRPRLVNNSPERVNISLGAPGPLRLLVSGKQIDKRWSPPPKTRSAGQTPILVECNGKKFWAIPPNVSRDATVVGNYYSGFTTSWDGMSLESGGSYFRPLRTRNGNPVQEGNLVFQVPLNSEGSADIYGFAVLAFAGDDVKVMGVETHDKWGLSVHPTTF